MNIANPSERILWLAAACSLVALVLFGCLLLADSSQILGVNRWLKPAKFAASIAIFTGTAALLVGPLGTRSVTAAWIARAVVASMAVELALITLQAARGVTSHFNSSTPFNAAVFQIMGLLILANTIAMAFLLREYVFRPPFLHPAMLSAIRAGLVLFLAASLEGFVMVALSRHTVGAPDGGPGLPLVNWSATHGDLRVAHFFGLHALQALPAVALLLPNRTLIRALAALWFCGFAYLLGRALMGLPLLTVPHPLQ